MGFWVVVVIIAAVIFGGWVLVRGWLAAPGLKRWLPPVVAALWIGWGLWESYVVGPEDNIRADLVLFLPIIFVATVASLALILQRT